MSFSDSKQMKWGTPDHLHGFGRDKYHTPQPFANPWFVSLAPSTNQRIHQLAMAEHEALQNPRHQVRGDRPWPGY